jgi:hypothetical protein
MQTEYLALRQFAVERLGAPALASCLSPRLSAAGGGKCM